MQPSPQKQIAGQNPSNSRAPITRSPLRFFLLVFALSLPFWLAGTFTGIQLMPGVPLSGLTFVCPVTAALICVYTEKKSAAMTELLRRSFDFKRTKAKIWYVPVVLLMPGIVVVSYGLMRWMGKPLPTAHLSVLTAIVLFLAFTVPALGEELGWSGYVIDPMQDRWGALPASILLGLVWAVWHIVPLMQVHRSPSWIAWWALGTVAARVILVWLYNNTGRSVFAAASVHIMMNVSWQLFPVHGSYFDERIIGLLTASVAGLVALISKVAQNTVTPSSMTSSSTLM